MTSEKPYTAEQLQALGLRPERLPRHVAIIMDGNGRWARAQGMPRIEGHRRGVQSVRSVVEEGVRLKLDQLTLYCFSSENWKRPRPELDLLMSLLRTYVVAERDEILRQNIRFVTIGRTDRISKRIFSEVQETIRLSQTNTGMQLCLALDYGARDELVRAVRQLMHKSQSQGLDPETLTEEMFAQHLDTAGMPDPDLVVRTAGEMRISNFLLWQISYAELWVTETLWPDFRATNLQQACLHFGQRERRFGGL